MLSTYPLINLTVWSTISKQIVNSTTLRRRGKKYIIQSVDFDLVRETMRIYF